MVRLLLYFAGFTLAGGLFGARIFRRPGVVFDPMVAAMVAGALLGGALGFQLLLPPEPAPGESPICGLMVLPALFMGLPVGFVLGGSIGLIGGVVFAYVKGVPPFRRADGGKNPVDWIDRDFE